MARPICFRLLEHFMRLAASRIFWTAGSSRPIRIAMIAITTSNSMSVKPERRCGRGRNTTHLRNENTEMRKDGPRGPSYRLLPLGDRRQTLLERGLVDLFDPAHRVGNVPLAIHPGLFPDDHEGRAVCL